MEIHLIRSQEVDKEFFTEVLSHLQHIQGPIQFHCDPQSLVDFKQDELASNEIADQTEFETKLMPVYSYSLPEERMEEKRVFPLFRETASWPALFEKASQYRRLKRIPENQFVFLITNISNDANWFASLDEKNPYNGFIHAADWDHYISCSASFPVAYEVIALMLQKFLFNGMRELREQIHQIPVGCVSDFCKNKKEIILKLRTADICVACLNRISGKISLPVLHHARSIIESLRVKMLYFQNFRQSIPLSPLLITKKKDLILPNFERAEVKLRPLEKTLYFLFLDYPEGIFMSNLCDHRERLYQIYAGLSSSGTLAEMHAKIDNMTNVLSNSASEKISRIKSVFEGLIGSKLAMHYYIRGEVGEQKKIALDRTLVIYE